MSSAYMCGCVIGRPGRPEESNYCSKHLTLEALKQQLEVWKKDRDEWVDLASDLKEKLDAANLQVERYRKALLEIRGYATYANAEGEIHDLIDDALRDTNDPCVEDQHRGTECKCCCIVRHCCSHHCCCFERTR